MEMLCCDGHHVGCRRGGALQAVQWRGKCEIYKRVDTPGGHFVFAARVGGSLAAGHCGCGLIRWPRVKRVAAGAAEVGGLGKIKTDWLEREI